MATRTRVVWAEILAFGRTERNAFTRGARVHLVVAGAGALILAGAAVFAQIEDIPGSILTREPQVVLDGRIYVGALSNLGALVWMTAVVMALVGWASTDDHSERHMYLAGASIGAALMVDDFFLFHEFVAHRSSVLEKVLIFSYLVAIIVLVAAKWRTLGPTAVAGVTATLGFLGGSVVLDAFLNSLDQLFENGLKFLGICMWATTWTLRARPWRFRSSTPQDHAPHHEVDVRDHAGVHRPVPEPLDLTDSIGVAGHEGAPVVRD